MKILKSKYAYWFMLLIPLFTLIIDLIVHSNAESEVYETMLKEKLLEATINVDMIGTLIESNLTRDIEDVESIVIELVNFIDKIDQVYCAAYKMDENNEPILISDRFAETSIFDPYEYRELVELINVQRIGNAVIGYTPENQTFRDLYVYFRWIPAERSPGYLVLAGVSEHAIQSKLDYWGSKGGTGRTIIILLIWNAWAAFIMLRIAYLNTDIFNSPIRKQLK